MTNETQTTHMLFLAPKLTYSVSAEHTVLECIPVKNRTTGVRFNNASSVWAYISEPFVPVFLYYSTFHLYREIGQYEKPSHLITSLGE